MQVPKVVAAGKRWHWSRSLSSLGTHVDQKKVRNQATFKHSKDVFKNRVKNQRTAALIHPLQRVHM